MTRRSILALVTAVPVLAQAPSQLPKETELEFTCPMDPDVRSPQPGRCPRCGMRLELRIFEPVSYPLQLTTAPAAIAPGRPIELQFRIFDPKTKAPVTKFEVVHEKLFHLFAVSQDLSWFLHDHPVLGRDGVFRLPITFPKTGLFAVFGDFYPTGGTPQWAPRFLLTSGTGSAVPSGVKLLPQLSPVRDQDVEVTLHFYPEAPVAGQKSILIFVVDPGDGIEQWLGAYGHAFWIGEDLIDAEHTHPEFQGQLQFHVFFPKPGTYRFWLQFQRLGKLHTVNFTIPVQG